MRAILFAFAISIVIALPVRAGDRGTVTNLPLPRFVSMKAGEGYARHGPGKTHRIDWVYKHRNQPLEVVAEYGHWRRVRDQDGMGGWMHYTLLSGNRTVLVLTDLLELRRLPEPGALVIAQAEMGVVATLGKCTQDWCRITAGRMTGWVPKADLWGVGLDELRE